MTSPYFPNPIDRYRYDIDPPGDQLPDTLGDGGALDDEGTAMVGDSGGAVFVWDGEEFALAGENTAANNPQFQFGATSGGTNDGACLHHYWTRAWIQSVLEGDYDPPTLATIIKSWATKAR